MKTGNHFLLILLFSIISYSINAQSVTTYPDGIRIERSSNNTSQPNGLLILGSEADSTYSLIEAIMPYRETNSDYYHFNPAIIGENIYKQNGYNDGVGVYGRGGGTGVFGETDYTDTIGGTGVVGRSHGMYGTGIVGESPINHVSHGTGVLAFGHVGVNAYGKEFGVRAEVPDSIGYYDQNTQSYAVIGNDNARAVEAINYSNYGTAITARHFAQYGVAVEAISPIDTGYQSHTIGVQANGTIGVAGYGKNAGITGHIPDSISIWNQNTQTNIQYFNDAAFAAVSGYAGAHPYAHGIDGFAGGTNSKGVNGYGHFIGTSGIIPDSVWVWNPVTETGANEANLSAFTGIEGYSDGTRQDVYSGHFNHHVYIGGSLMQPALIAPKESTSTARRKAEETSTLAKLMELELVEYEGKDLPFKQAKKPTGTFYGFYANQMKAVFPNLVKPGLQPIYEDYIREVKETKQTYEVVERKRLKKSTAPRFITKTDKNGKTYKVSVPRMPEFETYQEVVSVPKIITSKKKEKRVIGTETHLNIDYTSLIPVSIKATQEQQVIIEAQQEEITQLQTATEELQTQNEELQLKMEQLEKMVLALVDNKDISQKISVLQLQKAGLAQNVPNPFGGNTTVSYEIPKHIQAAELQVTNQQGKVVGTIPIEARGKGQTIIKANDFPSGAYFYSLLLDGKVFETKQMILAH